MMELFNELAIVGHVIQDEDCVIYLLADSFSTLVTALEANEEVPKMETVTERILHEERKQGKNTDISAEKAITIKQQFKRKPPKCRECGKYVSVYCYPTADMTTVLTPWIL